MKFTMFEKETKDEKYANNLLKLTNFKQDENGTLICPNSKKFNFKYTRNVKGNKYDRTEEIYECKDCTGYPYKEKCSPKSRENGTIRLNKELTSIHGALLCMNRSIQAEGMYGNLKWNKSYKRIPRKGIENVVLEFALIACGYNLFKYN